VSRILQASIRPCRGLSLPSAVLNSFQILLRKSRLAELGALRVFVVRTGLAPTHL